MAKNRSRQELFNLAWSGLKAQGFAESLDNDSCMYRSDEGLRCAIGHCIADEDYNDKLEGLTPRSDGGRAVRQAARISHGDIGFACALQGCHDENPAPDEMERSLRRFAATYGLTVPAS